MTVMEYVDVNYIEWKARVYLTADRHDPSSLCLAPSSPPLMLTIFLSPHADVE